MADTVLNIQPRPRTGTGGAREARRAGLVPGVVYGGDGAPQAVAAKANEFRKLLHTGQLMGRLVRLNTGGRRQAAIAKDIQFHPVTDEPVHFDFYRVDEKQEIRIAIAVHFRNEEDSPGIKRGGALNINMHEIEVLAPANSIPEELVADLTGLDIGDTVHLRDIKLPEGVKFAEDDLDIAVGSVTTSAAMESEAAEAAEEAAEGAEGEAAEAGAEEAAEDAAEGSSEEE
jgi:large subunit ribosomal protein L25